MADTGALDDPALVEAIAKEIAEMNEEIRSLRGAMTKSDAFVQLAETSGRLACDDPFAPGFKGENHWKKDDKNHSSMCALS